MKWFKRILVLFVILFIATSLHYFLPRRDIVQIVGTDVKRMDLGEKSKFWDKADAGTKEELTRDVRFINTIDQEGKSRVYRNEDTNWSFPPYFKFDSSDLSAKAQSFARQNGVWIAVTHYGWRLKVWSKYPNATKVKKVSGPDVTLVPWFNIIFLSVFALFVNGIIRMVFKFKKRRIDPIVDKIEDTAEAAHEEITEVKEEVGGFLKRVFKKNKH
ncbi:MAG: DUF1523 family protein [Robiginitomaculum sp.]